MGTDTELVHLQFLHIMIEVVREEGELEDDADQEPQQHAKQVVVLEQVEVETSEKQQGAED